MKKAEKEKEENKDLIKVLNGEGNQHSGATSMSDKQLNIQVALVNNSDDTLLSIQKKVLMNDMHPPAEMAQSEFCASQVYRRQKSIPQFQSWDEDTCLHKLQEESDNYFAHYQLALLHFQKQNLEETKAHLLKVHEIKSDFNIEKINKGLAEIYESEGEYHLALKHFKNTYIYTNDKLDIMLKIGKCYEKLTQKD